MTTKGESPSPVPELRLPDRRGGALPGAAFASTILSMPLSKMREDIICDQICHGNIPNFLRTFYPVTMDINIPGLEVRELTLWVLPDYLSVGSDTDYVRVPLGARTAQHIADVTGTFLPTRQVVNYIHAAASIQLPPIPRKPTAEMTSVGYFLAHNVTIQQQLHDRDAELGQLISGHKKDVVICKALEADHDDRVAIYGWCAPSGKPIQPLNAKAHDALYSDYSHGVRLVWRRVLVNGTFHRYDEILTDPKLAILLSDEGPLSTVRYPES